MNDSLKPSKTLSHLLRHEPEVYGLSLAPEGWVEVDALLRALAARGMAVTHEELARAVRESDKQRFAFDAEGLRIRAQQGHSTNVSMTFPRAEPPALLFHGTVARFLASIRARGLERRGRHHVHLSQSFEVAEGVGARRGDAVILQVDAARMQTAGFAFYRTDNGVWLTEHVPPAFLRFP